MKILAVETATLRESVAVVNDYEIMEISQDVKTHSAHLLKTIDDILKRSNIKLEDLDYLACSIGPGSFTGIRIGLSTMQAFSTALDIPLAGVPTLDVLAENVMDFNLTADKIRYVCPVILAKRDEIYGAVYKIGDKGLKQLGKYHYLPMKNFLEMIKEDKKILSQTVFLGDTEPFRAVIEDVLDKQAFIMPENFAFPHASSVARLARQLIKTKKKISSFPTPIYVRPFLTSPVRNSR